MERKKHQIDTDQQRYEVNYLPSTCDFFVVHSVFISEFLGGRVIFTYINIYPLQDSGIDKRQHVFKRSSPNQNMR